MLFLVWVAVISGVISLFVCHVYLNEAFYIFYNLAYAFNPTVADNILAVWDYAPIILSLFLVLVGIWLTQAREARTWEESRG